jgi:hypothetical protein
VGEYATQASPDRVLNNAGRAELHAEVSPAQMDAEGFVDLARRLDVALLYLQIDHVERDDLPTVDAIGADQPVPSGQMRVRALHNAANGLIGQGCGPTVGLRPRAPRR